MSLNGYFYLNTFNYLPKISFWRINHTFYTVHTYILMGNNHNCETYCKAKVCKVETVRLSSLTIELKSELTLKEQRLIAISFTALVFVNPIIHFKIKRDYTSTK